MKFCEECGAKNDDAGKFCVSCGAQFCSSAIYRYDMIVRCENAPQVGREEFSDAERKDSLLDDICNDAAEPDVLREYMGLLPDVSCSIIEIQDSEGNVVFRSSLDPSSAQSGFIRFAQDGECFDESSCIGKSYLYHFVNWLGQHWEWEIELEAPFESRNLCVRYKTFKDGDGVLHKVITGYEYRGEEIELGWNGGAGNDDPVCWVLEDGERRFVDLAEYTNAVDGEDDNDDEDEDDDDDDFFGDTNNDDDDEDYDGSEEGDVGKDLDMTRGYYVTIDGRNATMYMDNGQIVRRFHMRTNVIQATTSGQTVTILTDDGYTTLYSWTGQIIRRTKR